MTEPKKHWIRRLLEAMAALIALALVFAGIFSGATAWVDARIKAVVTDDAYVRKIAAEVRPSVIFDNESRVLVDQGAMKYFESFECTGQWSNSIAPHFPARIVIKGKQWMAQSPLLTSMDFSDFEATVERGTRFDWVYSLKASQFGSEVDKNTFRFRLEVFP